MMGDGKYAGHQIPELPDDLLSELAGLYPLKAAGYDLSQAEDLLISVAVHEERCRRASGGAKKNHVPTVKEFAAQIVAQGFRALSKVNHPDVNGETEAQRRLTVARGLLLPFVEKIQPEETGDGIEICSSGPRRTRRPPPSFDEGIGDDDVPF